MNAERREKHMRRMLAHGEKQQERQAELERGVKSVWELLRRADVQHNIQRKQRTP